MGFYTNDAKAALNFISEEVNVKKIISLYHRLKDLYNTIDFDKPIVFKSAAEEEVMWKSLSSLIPNAMNAESEIVVKTPNTTTTLNTENHIDKSCEKVEKIEYDGKILKFTETIRDTNQNNKGEPFVLVQKTHSFDGKFIREIEVIDNASNSPISVQSEERVIRYTKFRGLDFKVLEKKVDYVKSSMEISTKSKNSAKSSMMMWGSLSFMYVCIALQSKGIFLTSLNLIPAVLYGLTTSIHKHAYSKAFKQLKSYAEDLDELEIEMERQKQLIK